MLITAPNHNIPRLTTTVLGKKSKELFTGLLVYLKGQQYEQAALITPKPDQIAYLSQTK